MSYYFHPGAEAEHFESIAFFESRQPGLGASYLSEFETLMANVVHVPHRYRIERQPNIRCVSLQRFPFKVIFRDVEGVVQVLAISHKRRRPDYWLGTCCSFPAFNTAHAGRGLQSCTRTF